ncbi:MAG: DUF1800 domain-containing protein [Chitinophagaceae bacterium]|nr:DUF1800 domain-containing protein [Chitinophagaceae bacterium]
MSLSLKTRNHHLMWRAGFGPSVEQLADLDTLSPAQLFKALQLSSKTTPAYMDVAGDYLDGLKAGLEEAGRQQKKELSQEEKKKMQQMSRERIRSLNLTWFKEMVNSDAQLREKFALFWHGHFACRNLNVYYQQGLLDILRKNALGSFRDMLHAVSKSAAMLNFLNNQQNRKDHPNENFAREVMELFTLGRGNYTEQDIKEAARAFTGWSANLQGEFVFRRFQHDTGIKTVLGRTGNLTGEEVLDHLLAQKQTARFITRKLYRFFVNEQVDEAKVEWLSERFYQSNYQISKLAEDIFTSDWFFDEKNTGNHIKSPVELLVGIQRMLPMQLENEESLLFLQKALGQILFYPPNVAGWPGGKSWIDSSTLLLRMRIPQLIVDADELNIRAKDDDDQQMGKRNDADKMPVKGMNRRALIKATIDWKTYNEQYSKTEKDKLVDSIVGNLLMADSQINGSLIVQFSNSKSREDFVRSVTLQLMSLPEYQLA